MNFQTRSRYYCQPYVRRRIRMNETFKDYLISMIPPLSLKHIFILP